MNGRKNGAGIKTLIISAMIGLMISLVIMAVIIYFGYAKAYSLNVPAMDVKILTLPIYHLAKVGEKYAGSSIGKNMGIISMICMAASILVERLVHNVKKK